MQAAFRQQAQRVGSPPRAWGQCGLVAESLFVTRFTPTGVGTMLALLKTTDIGTVHPHGRGDNLEKKGERSTAGGSPPRAWGQWR